MYLKDANIKSQYHYLKDKMGSEHLTNCYRNNGCAHNEQ